MPAHPLAIARNHYITPEGCTQIYFPLSMRDALEKNYAKLGTPLIFGDCIESGYGKQVRTHSEKMKSGTMTMTTFVHSITPLQRHP